MVMILTAAAWVAAVAVLVALCRAPMLSDQVAAVEADTSVSADVDPFAPRGEDQRRAESDWLTDSEPILFRRASNTGRHRSV